nr:FAD-binding oxidoreductase [Candidatus Njordarchaeota archaeon]
MSRNKHSEVIRALQKIVGKDNVSDSPEELYYYSSDPSTENPHAPEYVVLPRTVEEIQEVVRLANREKIPITPRAGGLTLAGLAIPSSGGILLDLKRMNKIVDVNPNSMYAVVECGVTTGQLKTFLENTFPDLQFSVPHAPPIVSVVANAMVYGSGHVCLKYGTNSDMISGLEVILPTGEVLRTGACAVDNKSWFSKYCLPDFTGLFLGWFGATGIITKCAIELWPKPMIRDAVYYAIDEIDDMVEILLRLTKREVADDIYVNSWTGTSLDRYDMTEKPRGITELYLDVILSARSKEEYDSKRKTVEQIVEEERKKGRRIKSHSPPQSLREYILLVPQPLQFMDLKKGGGSEYLGCYVPTEKVGMAYREGVRIAKSHGFQYLQVIRPFKAGHATAIMYAFSFNHSNPEEVQRLQTVLAEICNSIMELGGIPWKPSPTLQKLILKRADPMFVEFIGKVKTMLDPNGIMAPDKWSTEE